MQQLAVALRRRVLQTGRVSRCLTTFANSRISLWEKEVARQQQQLLQSTNAGPIELRVHAPNASEAFNFTGEANESTPIDILSRMRENGLPKFQAVAAKVDGRHIVDLNRPLQASSDIELLDFSSDEGKHVFWHSSAHVLGQALEAYYGDKVRLCDGPALEEGGFFYEMFLQDGRTVSETDFPAIQKEMKRIVKARQPFERLLVSRDFAREIFAYSSFKREMLDNIPEDEEVTLYRCGPFIDLCRGPHVPHTGALTAFDITRCGASHWKDGEELLQRVYGISFPSKSELKEYNHLQEEARKRDHRIIGKNQGLFLFHQLSPGSSFFLPHGTRVFNKLTTFIRNQYKKRGYEEVITPLIFKKELWETSGHLQNYQDDMFMVSQGVVHDHSDAEGFGLKPMNCPGHCLLFKESKSYSYRELPVRLADFSALHRNEASGALTGLTRVRRFHQDDAHIFCRSDQVQEEIRQCLDFIQHVYGVFGFEFELRLSTRPDQFMGDVETWDDAETQLKQALTEFGAPWKLNAGDGAFYGPKIDVAVTDALQRKHQCGTIQLDFQLPRNFGLTYDGADGQEHTPIIVHRAVLGSVERMMAILIEHTGGKWPLWLSPRQVAVLPISENHAEYAHQVQQTLLDKLGEVYVDVQAGSKTLNKRVREAQLSGYNYILVVGDREREQKEVNVRTRDNQVHGTKSLDTFANEMKEAIERLE